MATLYFHPPGIKPIKKETIKLLKKQKRIRWIFWTLLTLSLSINVFLSYRLFLTTF